MENVTEFLANEGSGEKFNPADAPDETAWREAMGKDHAPTEKVRLDLQAAWDHAFVCVPDKTN